MQETLGTLSPAGDAGCCARSQAAYGQPADAGRVQGMGNVMMNRATAPAISFITFGVLACRAPAVMCCYR